MVTQLDTELDGVMKMAKNSNLVFEECDNVEFVKGITMVWMKF